MTSGDIWDVDDEYDEDAVSQEAPDATQGYSEQHYNYLLYGALDDKIVGGEILQWTCYRRKNGGASQRAT